ncbi:MAG: hypothetical protein WC176_08885 [Candidatus Cloacimonadaceae bacterium]
MVNGECPRCKYDFEKPAMRKRKCPKCKEQLYVSYYPWEDREARRYVLQTEHDEAEISWRDYSIFMDTMRQAYHIEGKFEDYNVEKQFLREEYLKHVQADDVYEYAKSIIEEYYGNYSEVCYESIVFAEILNRILENEHLELIDVQRMRHEFNLKKNISDVRRIRADELISKIEILTFDDGRCVHPELDGRIIDKNDPELERYLPCRECVDIVCSFISYIPDFD